ncbi:MAG: hypothetical protein CL928_00060 [Deltaproteobacteria bacterium]|nr:hypothetical protein [Deltaproteobacteria bacterium]
MTTDTGFVAGTVLWFRQDAGKGVVKADDGRRFFFGGSAGVSDPSKGLRVLVRNRPGASSDSNGADDVEVQLLGGVREYISLEPEPKRAPKKRAVARKTTKTSSTSSRTSKTGPKTGVVKRERRRGEALERGIPVLHQQHGQGFVVLSTKTFARIRFMPSGEERSIPVGDLQVLDHG